MKMMPLPPGWTNACGQGTRLRLKPAGINLQRSILLLRRSMTRRRTPGQPGNGLADGVNGGLRKRSLFPWAECTGAARSGNVSPAGAGRDREVCREEGCHAGPTGAGPGALLRRIFIANAPRYRNPWTEPHASFCPVCSVSWRRSAFFYHQEKIPDQTIPYQNYRRNHFKKLIQLPMHCFVADQRLSWEPGPCRSAPDAEKLPIQETRIANSAVRR
jgi:hypothetical protein